MASSTGAAPCAPATLPNSWLLRLAQSNALEHDNATLLSLIRTCTVLRDAVLRHHRAVAAFDVPMDAADFPGALDRLCVVARRSSNLKLVFDGGLDNRAAWTETEPCITHLLVCAAVRLGVQSLTCVKEVHLRNLEQTSLVPAWVTLLCPNVTTLNGYDRCRVAADLLLHQAQRQQQQQQQQATSRTHSAADHPRPLVAEHLRHLQCSTDMDLETNSAGVEEARQQLAALPSLATLTVDAFFWTFGEAAEFSSSVTCLCMKEGNPILHAVERVPAHLPNLVQLVAPRWMVRDDGLDALLTMRSLRHVHVRSLCHQRSHTHQPIPWTHLEVEGFDVGPFSLLHLDSIQRCTGPNPALWLGQGVDAAALARVSAAITGWVAAGSCKEGRIWVGAGVALWHDWLTDLPQLLAALPEAWRHRVLVCDAELTPESLQRLGQILPSSISTLRLEDCGLTPQAWSTLLPSLPATVTSVHLKMHDLVDEATLRAMCTAATRPITITVLQQFYAPSDEYQEAIRARVAQEGGGHHVTLQWVEDGGDVDESLRAMGG